MTNIKTMNVEVFHDGGAARSLRRVDIEKTIRQTLDGQTFTFAIHAPVDGGFVKVLSEYRSGRRVAELSFGAAYITAGRAPDIATIARRKLGELIDKHGAAKMRAVIESTNRVN